MNRLATQADIPGHGRTRRLKPAWVVAVLAVVGLVAIGCFPKSGAYPIEIFTEMHYSQAFRVQEPPRLGAVVGAQVFVDLPTDQTLEISEKQQRTYDPAVAGQLFAVNCSACHGANGLGDGPILPFLTSPDSYYASQNGSAYGAPPNLQDTRTRLSEDAVFGIVSSGINVMPRFTLLLSEEDRWDIVNYVFDTETGLGTK